MSAAVVADLRGVLERRWPGAVPVAHRTTPALATGVAELDGLLPGGGLPRGRLSVWEPGTGVTALLQAAAQETVRRGERAVWIDAAGTAWGAHWGSGAVLVRPGSPARAMECAEELVHTGGFALVVLQGARSAEGERVRLTRAVREGGTALVELSDSTAMAALRLRNHVGPDAYAWRTNAWGEPAAVESVRIRVCAAALGWGGEAEVRLPVVCDDLRLSMEPALGDRRGAAPR